MKERRIFITKCDKARLEELISVADEFGGRDRKDLEALADELDRADVVASAEVPADVVTMNSKVVLSDQKTGEKMTYVLVFPKDANVAEGRISAEASPLRHAPHTVEDLVADWDRAYSREQGCFPPGAFRVDKYWPPVGRVDNVYGDRHLICTCPPVESYAEAAE